MYFEFEDHHPDTPRVPRAISMYSAIVTTLLLYAVLIIAYLLMPAGWFTRTLQPIMPTDQPVRFVSIEPLTSRPALPKRAAPPSDLDRRARAPEPTKPAEAPKMEGNTPEKVISTPAEQAKGPQPPSDTPTKPSNTAVNIPQALAPPPSGGLGQSLRNLSKYLQNQTFSNPQGGVDEKGPDIQFDSKGVDFGPWLARFKLQVEHNWWPIIPPAAMTAKGHVVIQFNVHRDGRITDLRIVQPTENAGMNEAALNSLKLSNPTLPLPAEYPTDPCFFTVIFYYNDHPR